MESVDFSVNESKCMVSYDRSSAELKHLKSECFDFNIETSSDDTNQEIGVFEAKQDGTVIRRNQSEPFPTGSLKKDSVAVNKVNYNVTLKKADKSVKIGTYFL